MSGGPRELAQIRVQLQYKTEHAKIDCREKKTLSIDHRERKTLLKVSHASYLRTVKRDDR